MCILRYETKSFLKEKEQTVYVYARIENTGNRVRTVPTLMIWTKNDAKVIPEVYEIIQEECEKRKHTIIESPTVFLTDLKESVQSRVDALFLAHPELLRLSYYV